VEQNEAISRIEELLGYLTVNVLENANIQDDDLQLGNQSISGDSVSLNGVSFTFGNNNNNESSGANNNINSFSVTQMPVYTYGELLGLYENEKNSRLDMEANFQQKSKDSAKQVSHKRDQAFKSVYYRELLTHKKLNLTIFKEPYREKMQLLKRITFLPWFRYRRYL
jgi:hypothetical protein